MAEGGGWGSVAEGEVGGAWLRRVSWRSVAEGGGEVGGVWLRGGWGSMAEGGSWGSVAEGEVGGVWLRGGGWGSVAERGKLGECG